MSLYVSLPAVSKSGNLSLNTMANTKSAHKRVRQTEVRTERNRAEKTRMKTLRRKTLAAVAAGDQPAAAAAASIFSSAVDKAAKRNLIHPNKAANLKSKTAKALAVLA
ncbi:MAG: 30S ribosomal protein S20 [Verrucomicrobiota bacterium]